MPTAAGWRKREANPVLGGALGTCLTKPKAYYSHVMLYGSVTDPAIWP